MKWRTLEHNGVAFPPLYEPKGLSITMMGEVVNLTPEQEEMAYAWALKKDTQYVRDSVFIKNFLSDFLKCFPDKYRNASIEDIDFTRVNGYVEAERARKSDPQMKKILSAERKRIREELKSIYGQARIDGEVVDVANWMVEPPGIFMGRGNHPLRGRWKPRIFAEDVTLNLGEQAAIPPGNWGQVIHDHDSMWLARWNDKLTGKEKYVWLSDAATIKQKRERAKYDKAAELERNIENVRQRIREAMNSEDKRLRKIAMACYLIDKLAMRVGDEKEKDEADTVGATTLRVEHVKLSAGAIEFDFLGKDSVRWQKTIDLASEDRAVFKNFAELLNGKKPGDQIFDDISSRVVNHFLGKILPGLTAKVFRTYLATKEAKSYLTSLGPQVVKGSERLKMYHVKMANLMAAIKCNHKKAPPKNWENTLARKEEAVIKIENQLREAKTKRKQTRLQARLEQARLALDIALKTKEYNLNTSLKNYIDPRLFKAWGKVMGIDWRKVYTASLQRKFTWVVKASVKNLIRDFEAIYRPKPIPVVTAS